MTTRDMPNELWFRVLKKVSLSSLAYLASSKLERSDVSTSTHGWVPLDAICCVIEKRLESMEYQSTPYERWLLNHSTDPSRIHQSRTVDGDTEEPDNEQNNIDALTYLWVKTKARCKRCQVHQSEWGLCWSCRGTLRDTSSIDMGQIEVHTMYGSENDTATTYDNSERWYGGIATTTGIDADDRDTISTTTAAITKSMSKLTLDPIPLQVASKVATIYECMVIVSETCEISVQFEVQQDSCCFVSMDTNESGYSISSIDTFWYDPSLPDKLWHVDVTLCADIAINVLRTKVWSMVTSREWPKNLNTKF